MKPKGAAICGVIAVCGRHEDARCACKGSGILKDRRVAESALLGIRRSDLVAAIALTALK